MKLRTQLRGGAFWDRFGWLGAYDTYIFGRTHQMGAQLRSELSGEKWSAWVLYGLGTHLEAIESNQGLTLLNYLNIGGNYRIGPVSLTAGFYLLDAGTQDKRQLKELRDANQRVLGADLRIDTPYTGSLYLAGSYVGATRASYLSPAIEVMHSFGGRGMMENYLGTEKSESGTGSLANLALEWDYSTKRLLKTLDVNRGWLRGGDITLRLFGAYTYVNSKQADVDPAINRDQRAMLKWGAEGAWQALSWLGIAVRYDRVILDYQDDANSFRVISPRIIITTHWFDGALVYFQYSHYSYGARVALRPGQVPLETIPDDNVFKIQGQVAF